MYKILIVDDDVSIRRDLKVMLYGGSSGFQVIGEAENGRDALDKIALFEPDIVLLDIEMPVMDGLKTLLAIKEKEYHCKVIVLSFHDDFDNVRMALRIGATEYLLKQKLDAKEIMLVLTKAAEEIESEMGKKKEISNLKNLADISIKAIKSNLITDLLKGYVTDKNMVQKQMAIIKSDLVLERMVVCCLQINDFHRVSEVYPMWNKELLAFSADNILEEVVEKSGIALYGKTDGENHYIICCFNKQSSYLKINSIIFQILSEIVQNVKRYLNIQVSIGVSPIFQEIHEISDYSKQAACIANYKFLLGKGKIIHYSEVEKYNNNSISNEERKAFIHKISLSIVQNDISAETVLSDIFKEIEANHVNLDVIRNFNIEIISTIIRQLRELNIEEDVFGTNVFPYEYVNNLETKEELIIWLDSAVNYIREILATRVAPKNYRVEIKKAIEYIEKFYVNEICVEDVANHININKVYFSQIFKKETGQNFIDFLTGIRMEKAKSLLVTTGNKIYDVAMAVGFENYRYFTKLFKDITGMTPVEYRKFNSDR